MASNIPLGSYLDQSEVTEINQRFTSAAFIPDHQVLWTGILREEAQQWADQNGMQTLTTAMGSLMSRRDGKSLKAHSRYIHGASILFAQRIAAAGTQVVVLCPPPPDRVNPSGGTGFQTLEEPIIKNEVCRSGNAAFSISMCHPMVSGARDFCYEVWPQDNTSQWVERFGQIPYKARAWRPVSNALRPIVNPGSLKLPQKVLIKSERVENPNSSSKIQEQHPVISNVETSQPVDSKDRSRWHCITYVLSLLGSGSRRINSALWKFLWNLASSVKSAYHKVSRAIITALHDWSSRVASSRVLIEESTDTTRSADTADHVIGQSAEVESPKVVNLPLVTSQKAALKSSISEPTTQSMTFNKTSKPEAANATPNLSNNYPKMTGIKASTAFVCCVESRVGGQNMTIAAKEKGIQKPAPAVESTKSEKKNQKARKKEEQAEIARQEKKRVKEMNRMKEKNAIEEKRQRIEKARAQERDAEARKKRKKEQAILQEQHLKAQRSREQKKAIEEERLKAQRRKELGERAREEKRQRKERNKALNQQAREEKRRKKERNKALDQQAREEKRRKEEKNKALDQQARETSMMQKEEKKQAKGSMPVLMRLKLI